MQERSYDPNIHRDFIQRFNLPTAGTFSDFVLGKAFLNLSDVKWGDWVEDTMYDKQYGIRKFDHPDLDYDHAALLFCIHRANMCPDFYAGQPEHLKYGIAITFSNYDFTAGRFAELLHFPMFLELRTLYKEYRTAYPDVSTYSMAGNIDVILLSYENAFNYMRGNSLIGLHTEVSNTRIRDNIYSIAMSPLARTQDMLSKMTEKPLSSLPFVLNPTLNICNRTGVLQ